MGLDMYLYQRRKGETESVEVGYWRKANAIHRWFVKNVQDGKDDCDIYPVTREQLIELRKTCANIVSQDDETVKETLANLTLPTQSGCFFGDTEYNIFYYTKLNNTILMLDEVLLADNDCVYEYQSSW